MTLYHGTIMEYAEKIRREGIKAMPEQSFQIARYGSLYTLNDLRNEGYDTSKPHLTPREDIGRRYAEIRADYETAELEQTLAAMPIMRKVGGERKQNALPALVKVELPDNWRKYLKEDIQDEYGLVASRNIPAKYVQAVEPIAKQLELELEL